MKIRIAKKAGFCMGVRRAITLVLKLLNNNLSPIYTYGPLIHNPQILEHLNKLGVKVLKNIKEDMPSGYCIIRAHGIPPNERELLSKKHKIIDGTCPRVAKVQILAKKAIQEGRSVIIVGDEKHAEVKGILGYCRGRGYVINDVKELEKLPKEKSWVVLSQTTQTPKKFNKIAEKAKELFSDVKIINTICNATHIRQEEVKKLCKLCDTIIIIGGKFSANTKRLYEIAKKEGANAILIESPEELDYKSIKNAKQIGITAGASTPNWLINEVVDKLRSKEFFYRALKAFSFLNFLHALVFTFIILGFLNFFNLEERTFFLVPFSFFFFLFFYNFNNIRNLEELGFFYPIKKKVLQKHNLLVKFIIGISIICLFIFAILFKPRILSLAIITWLLGEFLRNGPLSFFIESIFFLGIALYLYPYWTLEFALVFLMSLFLILFIKLYFEVVYFQTDGFIIKNSFLSLLDFEEKKIDRIVNFLVGIGILLSLFFYKNLFLVISFIMLWIVCSFLYKFLKKRPLGQVIYLENLAIIPAFLFLFISFLHKNFFV